VIRYALACPDGHAFEAWFASAGSFDEQRQSGDVLCPQCGARDISKALMTPSVAGTKKKAGDVSLTANPPAELAEAIRTIRRNLTENAEYVGDRFAAEARRIHFEEAEKRGIYGEANLDDVRGLIDDGVEFHPLPALPEDHN
jgi:hypothetical protein